jgi:hypothetical protein
MNVGTIVKLKVDCLGNKAGTLGVVFYHYGDGIQAIFENGNYDGFSNHKTVGPVVETGLFLEEVGFEESLAGYKFQNVNTVSEDYRMGKFDIVWRWLGPEFEKCKIYADGNQPPHLRFKRNGSVFMLSKALDIVDFSHYEYEEFGKSLYPRWIKGDITVCPLYVVFRLKGV